MATILVVDDQPTNRDFLVTLLGYVGHVLLEAGDGAEALKRMRTEHPDLVIVDLDMPTMDGEEFVRQLRADPDIALTRVMFCTATYQQAEAWALAQRCGVQHVISKPAEPAVVLKSVAEALALVPPRTPPFASKGFYQEPLPVLMLRLVEQKEVLEREVAERKLVEQEREALYQLAHNLARTSDLHTAGEHLFAQTKKVLGAECGYLLLANAASTELRGVAAYGRDHKDFAQERVDLNEPTVASLAAHRKEVVVVTDYPQSPLVSERFRKKYHYVRELWSAPLMHGEQLIGVFSVGYLASQQIDAAKLRFFRLLGDEAALALERIRLAEGLQEREVRLRSLFEAPIIGVFFADLISGAIIDANEAFLQMLGYQRQDLLAGKLQWETLTPPAYHPLDEQGIEALRRSGTCAPFEKEYFRRDGSQIPVMVGAALLAGAPQTCVVFALDLSERRQAEKALLKERSFISAVLDTADTLIVVSDRQGHIVCFNHACEQLTGYSFAEVQGKCVLDLVPPDEINSTTVVLEKIHAGQVPYRHENYWVTKDGRHCLIAWSNTALFGDSGQIEYSIGIGMDITERRKTEQRQQVQFAVTRILAFASSLQEVASSLLQIFCEQLGWDLGELWLVTPDAQRLHCENIWQAPFLEAAEFEAFSRQTTFLSGQGLPGHIWASGRPVWIPDVTTETTFVRLRSAARVGLRAAVGFPIYSDGHVLGIITCFSRQIRQSDPGLLAVLADIGSQIGHFVARRRAEDSLQQLSGQLLRLQDEERRRIARDLHDSTAQNLSALAMLLTVVKETKTALEPQVRQSLAESREVAEQCLREVRTLSYLLHPPFLDERGLASALQWYVEGFMRRSNIEVHLDVASDVGRLPGDMELALFRIVQEGLTNIHQHSGSPVANLRVLREAHRVILTIADAGKGMPAEVVERMSTSGSPIGVGIAGMQERVRQLGGRLDIQSGRHVTTLVVTLPIAEGDA